MTKRDIDALVEAIPSCQTVSYGIGGPMKPCGLYNGRDLGNGDHVLDSRLRRALYLAAGLTAEGEAKPVREKAWLYIGAWNPDDRYRRIDGTWDGATFVPDGAEP